MLLGSMLCGKSVKGVRDEMRGVCLPEYLFTSGKLRVCMEVDGSKG